MAKLPEPELVRVEVVQDDELEDRKKQFFNMVALAITKAASKKRQPDKISK